MVNGNIIQDKKWIRVNFKRMIQLIMSLIIYSIVRIQQLIIFINLKSIMIKVLLILTIINNRIII